MAVVIDGKAQAALLRGRVKARVATLAFQPGLAVVLVGEDPASTVYVRNKDRAAQEAGLGRADDPAAGGYRSRRCYWQPYARSTMIRRVDGILVQLPLPSAPPTADAVIAAIDPAKDVDGLTTLNAGRLAEGRGVLSLDHPEGVALAPCTPRGVMLLLAAACPVLRGKRVRGAGALRPGRSARRVHADGGRCDGDGGPFAHGRPSRRMPPGGRAGGRRRAGRGWCGAAGSCAWGRW